MHFCLGVFVVVDVKIKRLTKAVTCENKTSMKYGSWTELVGEVVGGIMLEKPPDWR